ncbi:hypothetical protein [Nostoc sp. CALU 1950]
MEEKRVNHVDRTNTPEDWVKTPTSVKKLVEEIAIAPGETQNIPNSQFLL